MYRTNAIPPPDPPPTFWEKHGYKMVDSLKVAGVVTGIFAFGLLFVGGIAAALQFTVDGLAGKDVGEYPHYVVAVFLFSLYTVKANRES